MEVEDRSLWHHLIFCEGLQVNNDEENYIVCWRCNKSVLGGPVYKCLECNFYQHKSCTDRLYKEDIVIEHDLWDIHHMIFIAELENGGKEEVVCSVCEEPIFSLAYKCSIPKCTFLLHKSCTELSHMIQHAMHPEHSLFVRVPSGNNTCDVCHNNCRRSVFYRCSICDFDIDIKCVSRWRISADDCHQHQLFLMRKQVQFTCEACAEESKDIAYQCNVCRVLIHRKCARFPHTIKTTTHDHSLTRTYSLRQVEQQENVLCELCRKKVNTEYAVYNCRKCEYIAHLNCANYFKAKDDDQSAITVVEATQLVHLVEGVNLVEDERGSPREIKHFSHQHDLILLNKIENLMDGMRCEACMQSIISVPFYACAQCNFFLHNRCIKLPKIIKRGIFHEHPLTLLSQALSTNGLFWCRACYRYHHGFTYSCDRCKGYNWDIQCYFIPKSLQHKGHQHSLFLATRRSFDTCNACGETNLMNFVCTKCNKFTLCLRCATLPLVARYEYDTHLILRLSYTREDDSGEYYCLICEKERNNPNHWFYYCVQCKFTAHPQCVLGKNSYIKFGKTFIDKDHEHPLTIVQKTDHFPPCDACGESFIDMAFECTQCKFNVHPVNSQSWRKYSCLQIQSKKRVK